MGTPSLQIGYITDPLSAVEWPRARDMLAPAMKRGGLEWPAVERELCADTMQLIAIRKVGDPINLLACAVIRSAVTREGEALEIVAAAGRDFRTWAAWGMTALRDAARLSGMIGVQLGGRRGWRRVFRQAQAVGDMMRVSV